MLKLSGRYFVEFPVQSLVGPCCKLSQSDCLFNKVIYEPLWTPKTIPSLRTTHAQSGFWFVMVP